PGPPRPGGPPGDLARPPLPATAEPRPGSSDGAGSVPAPLSHGSDLAEWRSRARLLLAELRGWFTRNTYLPQWLPPSWRHPLVACGAAAVVEGLATLVTSPIVLLFPNFGFRGVVPLVGVVFFALQFGAAPGLRATVVGTVVLYAAILEPTTHSIRDEEAHILGILIYLLVNLAILLMASRTQKARRQAQEANEQMERFLGITSHELRTPLTSMKTSIQMAQRLAGRMPSEQAEPAEQIQGLLARANGQVGRLGRLVDDLLDVSRIRSDKLELHVAPCDLVALVRELTEEQRLAHPQRQIELRLPTQTSLSVRAD